MFEIEMRMGVGNKNAYFNTYFKKRKNFLEFRAFPRSNGQPVDLTVVDLAALDPEPRISMLQRMFFKLSHRMPFSVEESKDDEVLRNEVGALMRSRSTSNPEIIASHNPRYFYDMCIPCIMPQRVNDASYHYIKSVLGVRTAHAQLAKCPNHFLRAYAISAGEALQSDEHQRWLVSDFCELCSVVSRNISLHVAGFAYEDIQAMLSARLCLLYNELGLRDVQEDSICVASLADYLGHLAVIQFSRVDTMKYPVSVYHSVILIQLLLRVFTQKEGFISSLSSKGLRNLAFNGLCNAFEQTLLSTGCVSCLLKEFERHLSRCQILSAIGHFDIVCRCIMLFEGSSIDYTICPSDQCGSRETYNWLMRRDGSNTFQQHLNDVLDTFCSYAEIVSLNAYSDSNLILLKSVDPRILKILEHIVVSID